MDNLPQTLLTIAVVAIPVLFAITVHEAAHGWVASKRGDPTALMLGRVTFNPLRHIDPIGTILVPLTIYITSKSLVGVPFLFGWAKPVPVDWRRLRDPRWDMALVAIAGPGVNLLMALAWGLAIKLMALIVLVVPIPAATLYLFVDMCVIGILINLFLMALNLFPLLPLDGGRILNAMLPPRLSFRFSRLEPYGIFLLLALLFLPNGQPPGLIGVVLRPVVSTALNLMPASALVRDRFQI
jgi:Zn-dependent protease